MYLMLLSNSNLHKKITEAIIRSKMIFFDSNPIGRIFTRFSKDMTTMDLGLPGFLNWTTFVLLRTISGFVMVIAVFPGMLIVLTVAVFLMLAIIGQGMVPMR